MMDRYKKILVLSLPIIGGMLSQNLLNLIDTAMVGQLGDAPLAAVGLGSFTGFMCQALVLGISPGVQAIVSRRVGENKLATCASSLNGALLLIMIGAPLFSLILILITPHVYPYLNSDPQVIKEGVPYLQTRLAGIMFIGITMAFRGFWNGIQRPQFYLFALLITHFSNVVLNYCLIFGHWGAPALGTTGAGLASLFATFIGSFILFALGAKFGSKNGFLKTLPTKAEFISLIKLSLPNGIQQMFFAGGFTAFYWIIGQVGTHELAGANVMVNLTLVAILPGIGLGLAAAALVGEALGQGKAGAAYQWGFDVVKVGLVFMFMVGLPMWLIPQKLLSLFIINPETLNLSVAPLRLIGITIPLEALNLIFMNALLGAGDARRVMFVSIGTQWSLFLPIAYVAGPIYGWGLFPLWCLFCGYRFIQTLIFLGMWCSGKWKNIKV